MTSSKINPLSGPLRQRRQKRRAQQKRHLARQHRWGILGLGLLSLGLGLGLLLAGFFLHDVLRNLPAPETLASLLSPPNSPLLHPTRLTDRSGETTLALLAPPEPTRQYLPLYNLDGPQLPPALVQAVLAVNDPDFWQHHGARWDDLTNPAAHATLAQQLVADYLLWDEPPGLRRALRERILAIRLTQQYGREQILEWYLNHAYFGRLAVGAESAARLYLGKSAAELSLAEAALLAPLTQTPALNPYDAPRAAYQRQQETLALLQALGWVEAPRIQEARNQPLVLARPAPLPTEELLTQTVLAQAETFIPRQRLLRGGIEIRTSIDADLQAQAQCLVQAVRSPQPCPTGDLPFRQGYPVHAQALLLDVPSGEVLALAASAPALPAYHAAGSSLWPLVYLSGLTRGLNPSSLVWDIPQSTIVDWDNRYHGPERLRLALVNDDQAPLLQVLEQSGHYSLQQTLTAHGLDFSSTDPLLNGDQPIHLLTLAQTYAIWAGSGLRIGTPTQHGIQPTLVLEIVTLPREQPIVTPKTQAAAVLSPQLAYLMTDMLADPTIRRTPAATWLDLGTPAAVKLSFTPEKTTAWAAGYTTERLAVLWLGGTSPMDDALPAGLWNALLRAAQGETPPSPWQEPPGLSHLIVCDPSGKLPTEACQQTVEEIFLAGSEPVQADDFYQPYAINRETGLLATVFTPPDLVETRIYQNIPPKARDWAQANGWNPPPQRYDAILPPPPQPEAHISAPALFDYVRGQVAIMGTASGPDFAWYVLQSGSGLNPTRWEAIGTRASQPVENGRLGLWDTRQLEDGLYALRLQVVRQDSSLVTSNVLVTVDNTPPSLTLLSPATERPQTTGDGFLLIRAAVSDNLQIDSLAFYLDGKQLAQRTAPPWATLTPISAGTHTLRLVARDAAGNTTLVEQPIQIRP